MTNDRPDNPAYGYDVYVQRLGVYVQYKENSTSLPPDPDIKNPYARGHSPKAGWRRGYVPQLDSLDNGQTLDRPRLD